jgi:hypothetical protein
MKVIQQQEDSGGTGQVPQEPANRGCHQALLLYPAKRPPGYRSRQNFSQLREGADQPGTPTQVDSPLLGCLTANFAQDDVEKRPKGFAGTAAAATGREYTPSLGGGQTANFVDKPSFPYSRLSSDKEQGMPLSGKIALTLRPFGGMPDKGNREKAVVVTGRRDRDPSTACLPSGSIKENLLLLIEPQSFPEKGHGFQSRPRAVTALEISHRMCAQTGQCCELLLRQASRAAKTPQYGAERR